MIHYISRREHARDARRRCLPIEARFHPNVASLDIELIGEEFRVGRMANRNEYAMDIKRTLFLGLCVLNLDTRDAVVVPEHLAQGVIPGQGDISVLTAAGKKLILKNGLCTEAVPSMHQSYV